MRPITDGLSLQNRFETINEPMIVISNSQLGSSRPRWWSSTTAFVVLVLLGIGLRSAEMASGRNLWIDESMLALNVIDRAPAQLLEPLDWNQGAPVGFLLATKAIISQFGTSELTLRMIPFLGSILGLIAFAWLSPRLLHRPAAVLALTLFSISPYMLSYAAEFKQYATDAVATILLFCLASSLLKGESSFRQWLLLAIAGAVSVWCSHPAAFVLAGIGTALAASAIVRKDRSRFLAASLTIGTWLASFALCYFTCLRYLGTNQYLLDYWAGHFLPLPLKSPGDLAWLLDHYFAPFSYPAGLGGTEIRAGGIATIFFLIGIYSLARVQWPVAVAIVLPGFAALLASGLNKYPFAGRLLLFLVPLLVIGVAHGAAIVGSALRKVQPAAAVAMLGVLVAAPSLEAYQEVRRPMRFEQIDSTIAKVRADWHQGDRMYVYYGAIPAFKFYTRDAEFPAEVVMLGKEARANRLEYREQLAALKGSHRVWLLFSHRHKNEEQTIRAYAEGLGQCLHIETAPGAAAYLFDFTATPGCGICQEIAPPRDENKATIIRGGDR